MKTPDRILPGIALMLGFCLFAPLIDVASKLAAESIPVGTVTLWRYVWQGILMVPVLLILRLNPALPKGTFWLSFGRAFVSVLATFTFVAAIRTMPIANALAISFVEPFFILLIGHFLMGETVGPRRLGAAAVGFVGSLFVIQPSFSDFGPVALLPIGTALSFALYILFTRELSYRIGAVEMQFQTAVLSTLICLPVLVLGEAGHIYDISFDWPSGIVWLWVFGVGFFAATSHMAMTTALSFAPASTLAPLHYFEILASSFFAYLVFGNFPDAWSWFGIAIIISSGLYIIHRERVTAGQKPAEPA